MPTAAWPPSNFLMTCWQCPFNLPVSFTSPDKLDNHPKPLSYVETIYLALAPYLSRQTLSIQQAAALLNTSPRTLQRRLSAENTSFKNIRENIMLATACQLMENRHYSLTDIASELGYADIAHFSRAFKKLTGFPPQGLPQAFPDLTATTTKKRLTRGGFKSGKAF